jgi:hypothetical protein
MDKSSDDFLAAPSADVSRLLRAACSGDEEAARWFRDVYPRTALCVFCDGVVGPDRTTAVVADPIFADMSLLMPCCNRCASLPPKDRRTAELALARSMWPRVRWRPSRGNDPAFLRRGGPPKKRRAS